MKAQDIRTKLEKAQEVVTKKEATLDKYYKKAEKIRKQIAERGWNPDGDKHQRYGTSDHNDCYWMMCDLDDAQEGIDRTKKAIAEKKAVVAKWEVALKEAEEKENLIEKAIPDVLKDFQMAVIRNWDKWDAERRESLSKKYEEMRKADTDYAHRNAYKEFVMKYTYTVYEWMMYGTEEEDHRDNVKASERIMLNLWNRVKDITGDATDWSGLYLTNGNEWEGCTVNGIVKGTKGMASVETISAGGWNIQKFHYRTLVHEVKGA